MKVALGLVAALLRTAQTGRAVHKEGLGCG